MAARSRSSPRNRTSDPFPDAKAAGVVLWNSHGEFLIGYQPQKRAKWSEPGGKRFPGESVMTCAKRELREETGLDENIEGLTVQWDKPTHIPDCKYVFFQGQIGAGQPATSTTFSEYTFVPLSGIPSNSSFRLQRVAHFLRRGAAGERRADPSGTDALEQMLLRGAKH